MLRSEEAKENAAFGLDKLSFILKQHSNLLLSRVFNMWYESTLLTILEEVATTDVLMNSRSINSGLLGTAMPHS